MLIKTMGTSSDVELSRAEGGALPKSLSPLFASVNFIEIAESFECSESATDWPVSDTAGSGISVPFSGSDSSGSTTSTISSSISSSISDCASSTISDFCKLCASFSGTRGRQ